MNRIIQSVRYLLDVVRAVWEDGSWEHLDNTNSWAMMSWLHLCVQPFNRRTGKAIEERAVPQNTFLDEVSSAIWPFLTSLQFFHGRGFLMNP